MIGRIYERFAPLFNLCFGPVLLLPPIESFESESGNSCIPHLPEWLTIQQPTKLETRNAANKPFIAINISSTRITRCQVSRNPFPLPQILPRPIRCPLKSIQLPQSSLWPSALLDYHRINHQFILLKRRCSCVTITIECNLPRVCWRENSATLVLLWWWWWWWFIPELRMEYIHSSSRGWAGALSFVRWMAPCISVALHIACKCDSWTI